MTFQSPAVNFRVAHNALAASYAIMQPVLIWGGRGIGKTSLVQNFANSIQDGKLLNIGPALALGDRSMLTGLLKTLSHDDKGILLVDDVHLAQCSMASEVLPQLCKGYFGDMALPPGMLVCIVGFGTETAPYLPTEAIRRITDIRLTVDHDLWTAWGHETKRIDPAILGFVRLNPHLLSRQDEDHDRATPANWEAVSRTYCDTEISIDAREAIVLGRVGPGIAREFFSCMETMESADLTARAMEALAEGQMPDFHVTIPNLYAMIYHIPGTITDLPAAKAALRLIMGLDLIRAKHPNLPIPEMQILAGELAFEQMMKAGLYKQIAATDEFAAYEAWHRRS